MTRIEQIRQKHWHELGEQDVRALLAAWDTRDTALRALVEQWKADVAYLETVAGELANSNALASRIAVDATKAAASAITQKINALARLLEPEA